MKLQGKLYFHSANFFYMPEVTSSRRNAKKWIPVLLILLAIPAVAAYVFNTVEVEAKNAEMRKFHLPGKSVMILNSGSKAHYSRWTSPREVALEGEGFFNISKGAAFTVNTPIGTVTATAGKFNIRARGKKLEVRCYEGKLRVTSEINSSDLVHKNYILFEGKEMGWPMPEDRKLPGWMQQQLVFSNDKLEAVTAELQRKYNIKIQLQTKTARRFTGWLPANDREEALRIACEVFHLRLTKTGNRFLLSGESN